MHARALKCCSALHCSGLQHLPVFPCDSLFSLVLMAPPGLVSSAGLHSHTSLLVGHPGGNKVKAVLKASRSSRSSSLLYAPLSSASSVPINLVAPGDESSWMGERCLRQRLEQGPGCGRVPLYLLAELEDQANFMESTIRKK